MTRELHNSGAPTPGIPTFPLAGDVVTVSGEGVVVAPITIDAIGIDEAVARYAPTASSEALGAAEVLASVVADFLGEAQSTVAPAMGPIENP